MSKVPDTAAADPESVPDPLPEAVQPGAAPPDCRLVIVTAGVIADAVSAIAAVVAVPVVLVDDAAGPVTSQLEALALAGRDAVVLTDHEAPDTADVLRSLVSGPAGYVAMMGSRSRAARLFAALRDEGIAEDRLARLHVPAGLDVGGRTAGQIGLSVVAEVVAWANGKLVRQNDRGGLIHPG